MSTKNHSDPWRYTCPEGHTWVIARIGDDGNGKTASTKYKCRSCGWEGEKLYDQKTGKRV